MSMRLEESRSLRKAPISAESDPVDISLVSRRIKEAHKEASVFIVNNELRINLGIEGYSSESKSDMTKVLKNAVAARLITAQADRYSGLIGKIRRRFSSDDSRELKTAANALTLRNRRFINSLNNPQHHFLGAVNAAVNSLFDSLDPETSKDLSVHTLINRESLKSWSDHWRPLLFELHNGYI